VEYRATAGTGILALTMGWISPRTLPTLAGTRLIAFAVAALVTLLLPGCQTNQHEYRAPRTVTAASPASPRDALDRFLQFYLHVYGSGLPDATERAALAPLITPPFAAALESAARAERCASARHRGTEPPLVQGDVFSSLFEKANGVLGINEVANDGATAEYTLDFEYRAPGHPGQVPRWQDGVRLVRVGDAWLIDDFIHRGDWQFTSKGSVKAMLIDTAQLCVER